jgi:hypothetical protein
MWRLRLTRGSPSTLTALRRRLVSLAPHSPQSPLTRIAKHDPQAVLGGHCIPGGADTPGSANNFILNATTCTAGDIKLHWGELALQYF